MGGMKTGILVVADINEGEGSIPVNPSRIYCDGGIASGNGKM